MRARKDDPLNTRSVRVLFVRFRVISLIVSGSIGRATIHSIKAWPIIATFVAVWASATECLNSARFFSSHKALAIYFYKYLACFFMEGR